MKYFNYIEKEKLEHIFYKKPQEFDKNSNKDILKYALGAFLYVPANKYNQIYKSVVNQEKEPKPLAICLEDAIGEFGEKEAIESLELLKEIYKVPDCDFKDRVEKYADMLQVKEFLNLPVRQMSLGQRMKCDLIAALIHDPSILFLDEPTIGLDVATKDRLRAFILGLNRTKKVTVFLTTHDMQDVEKLCNRVILINHGRMLYDGDLESVKEKYIRYRNLKVVFNKTYSIDELKFLEDFQDLRIQNLDDKTMLIQYNYKLYSVTDIVSCLLKNTEVADFSIKDLEIEDVIKEVC